jgi:AcrR family transcriptional regulator
MKKTSGKGKTTRLRIIRVAADLFHKQGVHLTSPDEIIEVSGTGKGQFYYYFKNKEGLVHEVLLTHLDAIKSGTAPVDYEIKTWQDLDHWFLCQIDLQKKFNMARGCPFGTIASELTESDELIRQDLSLIFEVMKNKLATFLVMEKAKGRLLPEAHEEHLADFCIALIQGAMLMGKIKRKSQPGEATVHEAMKHLQRYLVHSSSSGQKEEARQSSKRH